jgi:capsular polysaccharide transport system permease protein
MVYGGWFLLAWITFGFALIIGALTDMFEVVERFVQISTYILIPISGAFFMAAWLPAPYRRLVLVLPFVHCFEIIRRGFFGEFATHPYYNVADALLWGCGFNVLGLTLVQFVRGRMEVE